jgi:hypothetical protein
VQGVPELVEQHPDLVDAQQRGLTDGRARDVEGVDHDRPGPEQVRLADERVHPRPAALGLARVEVGDVQAQPAPVHVEHLEDTHLGMVDGQVVALGEAQPVEQGGRAEHAVAQHALELEVGP